MAVIQLVNRAGEAAFGRPEDSCRFVVLLDKRDAHVPGARLDRDANLQPGVGVLHVVLPLGIAEILSDEALSRSPALRLAADVKSLEQRAVQTDLNLVRIAHPD